MASIQYQKNQTILRKGQSLSHLYLILKGTVKVSFPGGSYTLSKGDVMGICEIASDVHLFEYRALDDIIAANYAYSGFDSLEELFQANKDLAGLFNLSAFKQINHLFSAYSAAGFACGTYYHSCRDDYDSYKALCSRHMVTAKPLPALEAFEPFDDEHPIEDWLVSYYSGMYPFLAGGSLAGILQSSSVATGLAVKTALDSLSCVSACVELEEYKNAYYQIYFNENGEDLFSLYTSLYAKINPEHADRSLLYNDICGMITEAEAGGFLLPQNVQVRVEEFKAKAETPANPADSGSNPADDSDSQAVVLKQLTGSLDTILNYSQIDRDVATAFKENIFAYRELRDPSSTDSTAVHLRKKITETFYSLYEAVFFKSLSDTRLPMPVRLFLYFGYVDEELAGTQNLAPLYSLADYLEENQTDGVYTLYHWLKAIYRGEKEPGRNQFDEDYTDHVLSQKAAKNITEAEAKQLLADQNKKVLYELKNVFPVVNKMTYGRVSSYCPVFAAAQVVKSLKSCFVTPQSILQAIEQIRAIDFSAFYRETVYSNEAIGVPREFIHVELLPDFILMPNIGNRGVMWQEIEGKKRTTPSRMMLSVFQLEDLNHILVRLVGEFRWEMCKRIQGAHWNNLSEPSLTSEYFDYIQFYRRNHDLSADAKEKIKNSLQKARNNYKEMFIMDYVTWIMHEGSGSPRMNKIARQIMFSYCPFSLATRQALSGNPTYKELSDRYEIQLRHRIHHLDMLCQKISNSGHEIPVEIEEEKNFVKK